MTPILLIKNKKTVPLTILIILFLSTSLLITNNYFIQGSKYKSQERVIINVLESSRESDGTLTIGFDTSTLSPWNWNHLNELYFLSKTKFIYLNLKSGDFNRIDKKPRFIISGSNKLNQKIKEAKITAKEFRSEQILWKINKSQENHFDYRDENNNGNKKKNNIVNNLDKENNLCKYLKLDPFCIKK